MEAPFLSILRQMKADGVVPVRLPEFQPRMADAERLYLDQCRPSGDGFYIGPDGVEHFGGLSIFHDEAQPTTPTEGR
jgi:hypothetical protein